MVVCISSFVNRIQQVIHCQKRTNFMKCCISPLLLSTSLFLLHCLIVFSSAVVLLGDLRIFFSCFNECCSTTTKKRRAAAQSSEDSEFLRQIATTCTNLPSYSSRELRVSVSSALIKPTLHLSIPSVTQYAATAGRSTPSMLTWTERSLRTISNAMTHLPQHLCSSQDLPLLETWVPTMSMRGWFSGWWWVVFAVWW